MDFNKLEQKRIKKKKEYLFKLEVELKEGNSVMISAGAKRVGIELPIGKFKLRCKKETYGYNSLFIYICDEKGEEKEH